MDLTKRQNKKNFLILFGFLFLTVLFFNTNIASATVCWIETGTSPGAAASNCNAAQVDGTSGSVIMYLSSPTNAHGATANNPNYNNVVCCNLGSGSTSCTGDNKILGLSSATNAHVERPEGTIYTENICYSSLMNSFAADGAQPGPNEVEIISLSPSTNAHLGDYTFNVIAEVSSPPILCDLTSASWEFPEVTNGTQVNMIVGGTGCSDAQISFEVFRGSTACSSITGCVPPANVNFGSGATSATGTWTAGPASDTNYSFTARVVANPTESVQSPANLHVLSEPPPWCVDPATAPSYCWDYTTENDCNSNICGIDVQNSVPPGVDCSASGANCFCSWDVTASTCGPAVDYDNPGSHAECVNNMCVVVDGEGVTECAAIGAACVEPPTPNHAICVGNMCVVANGAGTNECAGNSNCIGEPPAHAECVNNMCVVVDGEGVTECAAIGAACVEPPTPNHAICVGNMCVVANGAGTNECAGNSQCVGAPPSGADIGTCYYTEDTTDDCDDGFLTLIWSTRWEWAPSNPTHSDPQGLQAKCLADNGLEDTLACPAQIPLPFFNLYNLLAAVLIIAIIYIAMHVRKGRKRR